MSLEGKMYVQGCDGLSFTVHHVDDSITNDVLQKSFQNFTGLSVDKSRDALDAPSSCQATDVLSCYMMMLRSTRSYYFSRHFDCLVPFPQF